MKKIVQMTMVALFLMTSSIAANAIEVVTALVGQTVRINVNNRFQGEWHNARIDVFIKGMPLPFPYPGITYSDGVLVISNIQLWHAEDYMFRKTDAVKSVEFVVRVIVVSDRLRMSAIHNQVPVKTPGVESGTGKGDAVKPDSMRLD